MPSIVLRLRLAAGAVVTVGLAGCAPPVEVYPVAVYEAPRVYLQPSIIPMSVPGPVAMVPEPVVAWPSPPPPPVMVAPPAVEPAVLAPPTAVRKPARRPHRKARHPTLRVRY